MVEVGIPSPRPPERGEKRNPPLHFFFLFLSRLSRHFLVSIHHFPMGENAAGPFGRVRQASAVLLNSSTRRCRKPTGETAGRSPLAKSRGNRTPHRSRPDRWQPHRAARSSSPPFRLSFLKTMEVHCNRQVLSRRYQFSHPGKNHLHSTERKIKSNPRTRLALSTPPVSTRPSPGSSSTNGMTLEPASRLDPPAMKVRELFGISTVPPFKAGADNSKGAPASQRRKDAPGA